MFAPPLALAACLVLALGAVACGGGSSNQETDVKNSVNQLYDALGSKDAKKVCNSLTEQGRKQIERAGGSRGGNCEALLRFALSAAGNQLKGVENTQVTDVKVDGDKATATVKYRGRSGKVQVVKENGDWKLSGLGSPSGQ